MGESESPEIARSGGRQDGRRMAHRLIRNSPRNTPAEHAFVASILLQLPRGLIFQPVVQYYMNCGGSSQNAVVLGFSTRINF
jgi:hypothetical protein